MASIGCAFLLYLAHLHILLSTFSTHADAGNLSHVPVPFRCHLDQAQALLKLKKSFSFVKSTTTLPSWRDGTDCCLWEGVGCDASSGNVTVLDLNNRGLSSNSLDPAVFSLASLRRLDLSMNDFGQTPWLEPDNIPAAGFERFALLTHLNLSNSGFYGQIPIGISKLVNLLSLDLSSSFDYVRHNGFYVANDPFLGPFYSFDTFNSLLEPNFDTLVANLSNLRELYLDGVDLSLAGEEWCISLATSVPRLQVLSLANCGLSGPIHKSLSRLHSLAVINLQGNSDITAGPFPEFFMDFLNLTVLQLSNTNLEGWFPSRSFQSKNLRVLDLSDNLDLSGHLPNLSNSNSLETLRICITNFSYAKQTSSSNFQSLKELSLGGNNLVSMDFLSSFGRLGSLCHLELMVDSISELGSIFSWIRNHKNLQSLVLVDCDFSMTTPSSVSNFKTLRSLTMVECNVPRSILSAIGNLVDLQTLEMNECTTYGSMLSSVGNLTNLRNMNIMGCEFSGPMPAAIGNLTNLRNMYIIDSGFSGQMPAAIGNLANLKTMEIQSNLFGMIPYAIGQLKKLTRLHLEACNFSGSIPSSIVNLTQLTKLDLSHNSLNGEIPSSIFTLPVLRELDLSGNQISGPIREFDKAPSQLESVDMSKNEFSGPIPKAFFQLTSLQRLDLSSNNVRGPMPAAIGNLANLIWLDLKGCNFSGSIPSSIVNLTWLTMLDLSYNSLSGEIPSSIFTLPVLRELDLSGNQFSGPIREFDKAHSQLESVDLSNNEFSGPIPKEFFQLTSLIRLDLSSNNLRGLVDLTSFWRLSSLTYLNLSHNMLTSIQLTSDVLPFTMTLYALDLSFNRLRGQIPMPNSSAIFLDYSNNRFSSVLPNWPFYLRLTTYLGMSKNSINGHIPTSICNSGVKALDLSHNNFSGPIPSCLIENSQLSVLNLRENNFEGMLPSNITTGCALQTIDLHGNKIEGQLPRGLSHCTKLEVLDLGSNRIADTFPSWLRGLSNLHVLVLRSNQFYGTISDIVGDNRSEECFPSLQIIDLASNNFSGNLRSQWFERLEAMMSKFNSSGTTLYQGNFTNITELYQDSIEITYKGSSMLFERILTTLTAIDFSNNRLEGTLPESIGRLVSLRILNMSHNAFTGKIPTQFGSMTDLESLDLSCNQLSGEIPQELTDLTFLASLNLSNNRLVGKIPQSRQFSTFDSNSFEGNAGLCGPPLSKLPCGASPSPIVPHVDKSSHHVDVVLFLFVGLGFGVGFAAAIVVKWDQIGKRFIATAKALLT